MIDDFKKLKYHAEKNPEDFKLWNALFEFCRLIDLKDAKPVVAQIQNHANRTARSTLKPEWVDLYRKGLFFAASYDFDSYMLYIEWNRPFEKKFYPPRRHFLNRMVQAYQKVFDGQLDLLTISQPKRTGKSQTGINFVNMVSGREPNSSTLMEGAGDALVKSFYDGCLNILQNPEEYGHYDVFPARIVSQNADIKTINLEKRTRFPTIMCRSIDATQVGLSEATNLLYLDDLIEDRTEAKDRRRLDNKWERLTGDVLGRRLEGTPIVATGTRYSLYDPIGRLQDHADKIGWRWESIEIPALDPITDESNYAHDREGRRIFTTEFLRRERELVSAEQWESEFQQQPFEAKGLMFPESQLNRYFELPVEKAPDAVVSVCDTAESGEDSVCMPIAYVYGDDVFIEDVVFDNSPPTVTKPLCAKKLVEHKVSTATFESNSAGEYFARDVGDIVKAQGRRISIRTKRTISNKQTRIEFASDGILKHFFFKDKTLYRSTDPYGVFMKELVTHTRSGKVKHDDAADGLSLLENELRNLVGSSVKIYDRPF